MDTIVIGGGQSGLTAARALREAGLSPVILEAGDQPTGSWSRYYDSLTLFSPACYSTIPGHPFPGDPDGYPHRDEVAAYLQRFAHSLDVEIRTNTRVTAVEPGFVVHTDDGQSLQAAGIVAATGSFGNPYVPEIPGNFTGRRLHVADYRNAKPYAGERVVVVGAGNSAVQIGYELAEVATVTLATRYPVQLIPQIIGGKDVHYWHTTTGFDTLPPAWLARIAQHTLVLDTGDYATALQDGRMDRRPVFTTFDGDTVIWSDGTREHVDTVIYATGYRPTSPTSHHSAPSSTSAASPPPTPASPTSVWNSSAPSPPTPCAASTPTPNTSPHRWQPGRVERSPPTGYELLRITQIPSASQAAGSVACARCRSASNPDRACKSSAMRSST